MERYVKSGLNMKIYNVNTNIFVQSVKNSKTINKKLLEWFEEQPKFDFGTSYNVSKTDWKTSDDMNRPYVQYLIKEFNQYINNIGSVLHTKNCSIYDMWFQQYEKNDSHSWHNHANANWANVYFVELPSDELATQFVDINVKDIKEGDLLTFPAYLMHKSPVNNSTNRKTIVSFNSNYTDYNGALTI